MPGRPSWFAVLRRARFAVAALAGPLLAAAVTASGASAACPSTLVVAQDGSGDHATVQAAVDAVPVGNTSRVTIRIKPGTYRELVTVPATKPPSPTAAVRTARPAAHPSSSTATTSWRST